MRSPISISVAVLLGLVGCKSTDLTVPRSHHQKGEYLKAVTSMDKIVPMAVNEAGEPYHKAKRSADNLWLVLEDGKYQIDAGLWEEARSTLAEALTILENLEDEATISLGAVQSGAAGIAVDDRQSDYIGTTYDRILVASYLSLCELMLGNFDRAAVAARKMEEWQLVAKEARAKLDDRKAEELEAAKEEGFEFDGEDFLSVIPEDEDDVRAAYVNTLKGVGDWSKVPPSDYSIPAAQFIGAIAHAAAGNVSEKGKMLNSALRNAPQCAEARKFVLQPGKVVVLFETGAVPYRVDDSVWFAYPYTLNGQQSFSTVKVSVPALAFEGEGSRPGLSQLVTNEKDDDHFRTYRRVDSLAVTAGEQTTQTQLLSSLTGLVALEFKEALPSIWFREMARVIVREVVQVQVNKALADEHGTAGMLAGAIGGAIIKSQFEPDLRGWESLPAEYQVAVVDASPDGRLEFQLSDSSLVEPVVLEGITPDVPTLVFARSSGPGTLIVHSAPLAARP